VAEPSSRLVAAARDFGVQLGEQLAGGFRSEVFPPVPVTELRW